MRLIDAKEVAEILQVKVQRVYELTRREVLPSVRIGPRQIRYEETRLMQWIEHGGRLNAESLKRKSLPKGLSAKAGRALQAVGAEAVADATRAVKDLRCTSMNSAKLSPFASSLSALFAPARKANRDCCAQLTQHQFAISIWSNECR